MTVFPATNPPTVAFSVCTVTAMAETVTSCACEPISRLRFTTAVSVMFTVTDGTSAVLKPDADNFTL